RRDYSKIEITVIGPADLDSINRLQDEGVSRVTIGPPAFELEALRSAWKRSIETLSPGSEASSLRRSTNGAEPRQYLFFSEHGSKSLRCHALEPIRWRAPRAKNDYKMPAAPARSTTPGAPATL